jgi:hypothetical protein
MSRVQINSRILPSAMLRAIWPASGVSRARASTRFFVCSKVAFSGRGGSFGSTVASTLPAVPKGREYDQRADSFRSPKCTNHYLRPARCNISANRRASVGAALFWSLSK